MSRNAARAWDAAVIGLPILALLIFDVLPYVLA